MALLNYIVPWVKPRYTLAVIKLFLLYLKSTESRNFAQKICFRIKAKKSTNSGPILEFLAEDPSSRDCASPGLVLRSGVPRTWIRGETDNRAKIIRKIFGFLLTSGIYFVLFSVLCSLSTARADHLNNGGIKRFFGVYVGQADIVEGDDSRKRDLEVKISPYRRGRGFTIEWVTVSYHKERKEPGVKRRYTTMSFTPTERDGLYKPEYSNDVFSIGEEENGRDQIIWARLSGNTLSLYALHVNNKGDYVLHTYHRQLTDKGLLLQFEALQNGVPTRHVEGELVRIKEEGDENG